MNDFRLPQLEHHAPEALGELLAMKAELGADSVILAGGTDLVPLLKRRNIRPRKIIALSSVKELREISRTADNGLRIGAGVTLRQIQDDPAVKRSYPALARAASSVAFNQIRNMGTLVGNACLDNKCGFFNQSAFWWKSREDCIKRGGTRCYAVRSGRQCHALSAADTVSALVALGAELEIRCSGSSRQIPIRDFYTGDGARPQDLACDEVVIAVILPQPDPCWVQGYAKKSARGSVDFAIASLCILLKTREGCVEDARIGVNGVSSRPIRAIRTEEFLVGREVDTAAVQEASRILVSEVKPISPIGATPLLRRRILEALFVDLMEEILRSPVPPA